jgi:hypothetical protein
MGPGCPEGGPAVLKRAWLSGRRSGCPEWGPAVRKGVRLSGMGPGSPEGSPAVRNVARLSGIGPGCPERDPALRKGARLSGRRPGTRMFCVCLCLTLYHHDLSIYKLTLSDQIQFTLHWTVSRCDFVEIFLASPPLLDGVGVRLQGLKTSLKIRPHLCCANRSYI